MGKPLAIPRILGINWWSLLVISLFESYARYLFRVPHWVPEIWEFWMLGQALWLRLAQPSSIAIYLYLASGAASMLLVVMEERPATPAWIGLSLSLLFFCGYVAGIFQFRDEIVRHFKWTDPRGVELRGVWGLVFGVLYFQYWFHQIYLEQQQLHLEV
jgi:hypothetical protein